jgi:hypothetical protein
MMLAIILTAVLAVPAFVASMLARHVA